jgi:hypothetical protein
MPYLVSFPVVKGDGFAKFFNSEDPEAIDRWVKAEDRPGRGVYQIMNPVVDPRVTHTKDNLAGIRYIYADVDAKDLEDAPEAIEARLLCLPLRPTWVARSGHGWHVVYELRVPVGRDDEGFNFAVALQEQIVEWLSADRSVRPCCACPVLPTGNTSHTCRAR